MVFTFDTLTLINVYSQTQSVILMKCSMERKKNKWIICTVNAEYEWEKSQGITLCLSHAPKDSSLMMQMQIISIQISLVYQFNIINHKRANGICIDASVPSCLSVKLQSMECICNLLFICLFAIQIKLLFCFVEFFFFGNI